MQLVVWTLVVLSVLYSQGTDACPDKCSCSKSNTCDGTYVNCFSRGLTGVPTNIPTDTCRLDLESNNITTLPNGIFDALKKLETLWLSSNKITTLPIGIFDALTSLQKLYLHSNAITTLPNAIFDALANLHTLHLSENKITTLPIGIFGALTSLQKLYLSSNQLTTLQTGTFDQLANLQTLDLRLNALTTLQTGTFDQLANLQTLYLSSNQLTTLQTGTFDQLANLQTLDLMHNALTTLQTGTFDQLANLQTLVVGGNPLHCDCQLVAFIRFMKTRRLQLKPHWWRTEPSCQNPLNLKETLLKTISLQEVVCDSGNATTQTYTTDVASVNSFVNPGDDYVGLCKISGLGTLDIITNLEVKWYHNSKLLTSQCTLEDVSMAEKYSCKVLPPQQNNISLELTVMDVQKEDVGSLTCELMQQVKKNGIWKDELLEKESVEIKLRDSTTVTTGIDTTVLDFRSASTDADTTVTEIAGFGKYSTCTKTFGHCIMRYCCFIK